MKGESMSDEFLTRKKLMKMTGATPEQINYLRWRGRLPVLNEPDKGVPAKYAPEAIEIIREWLERKSR